MRGRKVIVVSPAPLLLPLLLAGCDGVQAVLSPAGPEAAEVATLSWVLFIGGAAIFVGVMALAAYALLSPPARRRWLSRPATVVAAGGIFPVVTLTVLLTYGLVLTEWTQTTAETPVAGATPLRIDVVGEQWWWRVTYLDDDGAPVFETANEIRIPVGRPVQFTLRSADVIHSFWVPKLGGKRDMIPGRVNQLTLTASEPGLFRGQCAEYCGGPHAMMAFEVMALAPAAFDQWLDAQRQPARAPADDFARQGLALFLGHGCGACHSVRGTAAAGRIGPDLTHLGGRRTLAAASFPTNQGTLAGWIADNQHLKPGNHMPAFAVFTGVELRALAAYLEGLE